MLSIPFGALKMFFFRRSDKEEKKEGENVSKHLVPLWKCIFHFKLNWFLQGLAAFRVEQTACLFLCFTKKKGKKNPTTVLQLLSLNISLCFMGLFFFFFSLATVANNFIICIALIAVIKQTQRTPTLRRASSQPRSQLRLCFFPQGGREGGRVGWLCARLKRNYQRFFFIIFIFYYLFISPSPSNC